MATQDINTLIYDEISAYVDFTKAMKRGKMPEYLQAWLEKLPPKQLAAIYEWLKENPDAAEQMIEVLSESQE